MSAIAEELYVETELDRIFRWRRDELLRAGYSWDAACIVASHHEVDLHEAVELLDRGCAHDLALEILL